MISTDLKDIPKKVLAIGAHPDDVEFNSYGTLAKWAIAGSEITIAVMTDGSKGSWDPTEDIENLIKTRKIEARQAAELINADIYFCDYVDGELEFKSETVKKVAELIRQFKPELIVTHDPFKKYRLHPDHRNCGQIVLDAVVAARDPHFLKELNIKHHRPDKILLFEPEEIDHLETVDEVLDLKVKALLKHKSQYVTTMDITDSSDSNQIRRFENWIFQFAHSAGELIERPAECFKLIDKI